MVRILFIDDDVHTHRILKMVMPPDFFIITATRGRRGLELLQKETPDVVLLDIDLPDINGLEVLKYITEAPFSPPVVMLTGFSERKLIVRAMKSGACDYITKPYDAGELKHSIRKAISIKETLPNYVTETDLRFPDFLGMSPAICRIKKLITMYAKSEKTVLLTGESGTGKDITAGMIHSLSKRSRNPFIAINCAAIPLQLFETELFGSERGAYTDAVTRAGSFELANRGTLFLDEIGETAIESQAKLLRVIEQQEIKRVGSTRRIPVDVRLIAATNQNLEKAIDEDRFRQDLYYRLNILAIELPPLRERKEDIPIIAAYFLKKAEEEHRPCTRSTSECGPTKKPARLSADSIQKLSSHTWPGNIRELKNVIDRAVVFSEGGDIHPRHIQF